MKLLKIVESVVLDEARNMKARKKLPKGGNCFDAAYDYMMSNSSTMPNLKIVHGMVQGQGPLHGWEFTHAWNENDGEVIDTSNGKEMKIAKEFYYMLGNIKENECHYYDFNETLKKANEHVNKGPWDIENDYRPCKWNREERYFG
jgi:hypothetical protein